MKYRNIILMAVAGIMVASSTIASSPFTVGEISIPASVSQTSGTSKAVSADNGAAASNPASRQIGFVNVKTRLNVRTGPWGKIIGKLYDGDKLKIVSKEGDWLKIEYNGGYAYVHSNYVEVGNERAASNSGNSGNNSGSVTGPTGTLPNGTLNPSHYGYNAKMFKSVFDIVEKFCSSNKAYVFGAGHKNTSGYAEKTDCSGFVGQFIQKMSAAAGVNPVFPKNSWYPSSQIYKSQHTNKVTSKFPPPNPRDLIRPGDVFVMNPGSSGVGHVGLFMGYTPSGQPIIAHSTPTRVKSSTRVAGKVGYSGVRIEVLPARYASRWAGVYRVKNMDTMLDRLSKT